MASHQLPQPPLYSLFRTLAQIVCTAQDNEMKQEPLEIYEQNKGKNKISLISSKGLCKQERSNVQTRNELIKELVVVV